MTEQEAKWLEEKRAKPELCRNKDFIKRGVRITPEFIKFDETNSDGVYLEYVTAKQKLAGSNERLLEALNKLKMEILEPAEAKNDKYKIPHRYLYENIRRAERDECLSPFDINNYFELDGRFNRKYGEQIQTLYDDQENVLGMHGSTVIQEEQIKQILREGLRATTQGGGPGHLASHVYYGNKLVFLQAISFIRNSPNITETIFLLKIPRGVFSQEEPICLYGSNTPFLNEEAHILPQYMFGYIKRRGANDGASQEEQIFDRTIYVNEEQPIIYTYGFHEIEIDPSGQPTVIERKTRGLSITFE